MVICCKLFTHIPIALRGKFDFFESEPYYRGGVRPSSLQGENDIDGTKMNRDIGGENKFLELNAHTDISNQDIVIHEQNEGIRDERDNCKKATYKDN